METSPHTVAPVARARRRRAVAVVILLAASTMLGLTWAWSHSQDTVGHFWWVTQLLPLFYLGLVVWASWPLPGEGTE